MPTPDAHAAYYRNGAKHPLPNAKHLWQTDETRQLHEANRPEDLELAKALGRTLRAIHIRRCRTKPGVGAR